MSKIIATKPYDIHSTEKDVVVLKDYTGDNSTIAFKRSAPKRVKDFPGMAKSETKYTLLDVTGGLIGLVSISTSVRADSTPVQRTDIMTCTKAVLADDIWLNLVTDQRLPFSV